MTLLLAVLLSIAVQGAPPSQAPQAQPPGDGPVYVVAYVEVAPGSESAALSALKQYRDASRKADGNLRLEALQQAGRADHFAVLELWRDQKAFEAHSKSESARQLREKLQPNLLSPYDERPHRALAGGSAPARMGGAVYVLTHADAAGQGPARDQAIALLTKLAETSRKEEGNVGLEILQQISRTNHSTIVEIWRDQQAFDRHRSAAPAREFREKFHPLSGALYDERVYRSIE